ncbi:RNA polymerase sigma factor [Candidatus Giovannonibacteria bacterium]|nr:RNA polymerase sigma factor [Candidatus Giovannonibacteria bacterium]
MEETDNKIALEKAYELYSGTILRFIFFKVSDYAAAEDITAQAFVKLWQKMSRGEEIRNERALLYTIARGLVVDHYRKSQNKNMSLDQIPESMLPSGENLQEIAETKYQSEHILQAMSKLRDEDRDALNMYYIDELSIPEISAILNKSENATRVVIHRALKKLREYV